MTKDDWAYVLGIVCWFSMQTSSPTQRRMALAVMKKLAKEINHD